MDIKAGIYSGLTVLYFIGLVTLLYTPELYGLTLFSKTQMWIAGIYSVVPLTILLFLLFYWLFSMIICKHR